MKKLVLVAFGAILSLGAMAQTKQEEKKDLRDEVRDKRAHRKQMHRNITHLRLGKAHQQHEKLQDARKAEHVKAKHLRNRGEEHPTRDAKKTIHKQHEAAEKKNGG